MKKTIFATGVWMAAMWMAGSVYAQNAEKTENEEVLFVDGILGVRIAPYGEGGI